MSDPITSTPAAGATPKPASRWEDFIDIFYAPSDVYARRQDSGFGIPMLVVTLVGAIIFFATANALAPIMDAEMAKGMATAVKNGAKPEQLASMRSIGEKIAKVMIFIAPPVMMFLVGLTLWIVGKLVGAKQTLNAALVVTAYANVPRIVGSLLGGAQAMMMDPSALTSRYAITESAARFMDPATASPVALALAGRIDLFTIWATVLLAIGLAVTGKIPRSRAAVAAFIVWLVGSLPELVGALRQAAAG